MSVRTRKKARAQESRAQYDAAGVGRRMRGWKAPSTGPVRAVEGQTRVRDRARDAARNDWAGAASSQKWTTALVGVGVTPRWESERHTDLWTECVPLLDADCVSDAYALQTLATLSWFSAGEVFVRRRWRSDLAPLPVPVQVQLIESDMVPMLTTDTWPGLPKGNRIVQGIELNKWGRRVAYWMHREHPGDGAISFDTSLVRVLAADISHVFEPARPGAMRGVSSLAPVLARLRASGDLEDGVLERQRITNLFAMFVKKSLPSTWTSNDPFIDSTTGLPKAWGGPSNIALEPGATMDLLPGEDIVYPNPPDAGVAYPDYLRTLHLGTAAGGGLPYEVMSGDVRDVGDRVLRVVMQEFRRFAKQRQWQVLVPKVCVPMVTWIADAAVASGRMRMSQRKAFIACEWATHGWDYMHPVQDVEGKKLAVEAGFTSVSAVISEQGDDPRKVFRQNAADRQLRESLGLPDPNAKPAAPAPAADASLLGMVLAQANVSLAKFDRLASELTITRLEAKERDQQAQVERDAERHRAQMIGFEARLNGLQSALAAALEDQAQRAALENEIAMAHQEAAEREQQMAANAARLAATQAELESERAARLKADERIDTLMAAQSDAVEAVARASETRNVVVVAQMPDRETVLSGVLRDENGDLIGATQTTRTVSSNAVAH